MERRMLSVMTLGAIVVALTLIALPSESAATDVVPFTVSIPTVSGHADRNTTSGIFELTGSTTLMMGCAHQETDQPLMRSRDSLQLCIAGR
jgi:hypothetical protein